MQAFSDIISQTFRILWAHKLRSFLTMFGIAWGVGSLLLLVGLGEGFRSGQAKNLSNGSVHDGAIGTPATGYSILNADSLSAATDLAKTLRTLERQRVALRKVFR